MQRKKAKKEEPKPAYTEDEVKLCKEVLESKDYYKMLKVDKTVKMKELKKAYKSLSLKVHPDKNRAPDANEAFKKVNAAMSCL